MTKKKKGFIAIIVFFFVIAIALVVAPIIMQNLSFHALSEPERAFFLAESGINYYVKNQVPLTDDDWSDNTASISGNLGGGTFSVWVSAATLNSITLRSTGTITIGSTDFNRTIEYVVRRITPGLSGSLNALGPPPSCGDVNLDFVQNATINPDDDGFGNIYIRGNFITDHANNLEVNVEVEMLSDSCLVMNWPHWEAQGDYIIDGSETPADLTAMGIVKDLDLVNRTLTYEFNEALYDGVYYVSFDPDLDPNVDEVYVMFDNNNATLNGSVIIEKGSILAGNANNLIFNGELGIPVLMAGYDIDLGQGNNITINGAVITGGNIISDQTNNVTLSGSMTAGCNLNGDHLNNVNITYQDYEINTGGFNCLPSSKYNIKKFKEIP